MVTIFRRHLPVLGAFVLLGSLWATTAMSVPASAATISLASPAPLDSLQVELGPFNSNGTAGNDLYFTSVAESEGGGLFDFTGTRGSGIAGGTAELSIGVPGNFAPGDYSAANGLKISMSGGGEGGVPSCISTGGTAHVDQVSYQANGQFASLALKYSIDCLNLSSSTSSPYFRGTLAYYVQPSTPGSGYYDYEGNGRITGFGNDSYLNYLGDLSTTKLNKPIVGMATVPDGAGYWMVATDGGVFTFGDAAFHGSAGAIHLNKPIVGMATTPDGGGYWLVASDGGIFNYGDAAFHGSTGAINLNKPIVGMATTPEGSGYWLVASDGGIFSFGDAKFYGSTGAIHLNKPIVGMATTPDGKGYWLVASDGGIFNYGDAKFEGSAGAVPLKAPIVGMTPTPDGKGYWFTASDGGIFNYGDAAYAGSLGASGQTDIVGITH